ncbi:hypothetical protein [uncultured Paraglaciecola sp.]|uniref:hypothetical protein n=1 Tax=uncultured Paraglaciecola sp. TaxID=1765024 RepID=UPI002603A429|nr:hypothetical protein [uncultured Paraglaciecola sp.]
MNLTIAGKNLMLSGDWDPTSLVGALFTSGDYTADELTGTGYARQAITYDAPAGGVLSVDDDNLATFTIPVAAEGETVDFTHAAIYAGATRVGEGAITPQSYSTGGTYTLNEADITLSDVM